MKSSVMPPVRTTSTRVAYQRPGDTEKSHTARKLQELNIATPYCNAAASEHGSFASDQSRTPTQGGMGSFKMNVQDSSRARPSFATANKDNYQKSSGPYTRSMPSAAATSRASNYSASNMYPDSYVAPRHRDVDRLGSAGNPAGSRGNTYTKPDQPRSQLYARSLFRPGMIVRAALHEDYKGVSGNSAMTRGNTAVTPSDPNITPSRHGNIHTKYRKMIVVACHDRHYVSVPLFTHNNRGLINKNADEYISVRDHRDPAGFVELSAHGQLKTEKLHEGLYLYEPKSTAHFTYPLSRVYDLPVVHEGNLAPTSTQLLVGLYNRYAPK